MTFSPASPNVYEIHLSALYITIPFKTSHAATLTAPPLTPAAHNNTNYLVIVIDHLNTLRFYLPYCNTPLPTGTSGWMTKMNLLVTTPSPPLSPPNPALPGYQILSLDFERGASGYVKKLGALATQKVPSHSGVTYTTNATPGSTGEDVSQYNMTMSSGGSTLVDIKGTTRPLQPADESLAAFVIDRPHKFLLQNKSRVAWSPWGAGHSSTLTGVRVVEPTLVNVDGILDRNGEGLRESLDLEKVTVFWQPKYTLIDLHNTVIG